MTKICLEMTSFGGENVVLINKPSTVAVSALHWWDYLEGGHLFYKSLS